MKSTTMVNDVLGYLAILLTISVVCTGLIIIRDSPMSGIIMVIGPLMYFTKEE